MISKFKKLNNVIYIKLRIILQSNPFLIQDLQVSKCKYFIDFTKLKGSVIVEEQNDNIEIIFLSF